MKENLRKINIIVIGDVMLDKYIFGESTRLSPEAPVPIVNVDWEEYRLGGAANVANNLDRLNVTTNLIGITGHDHDYKKLNTVINSTNIINNVRPIEGYRTIKKVRIISSDHHITRLDYEQKDSSDIDLSKFYLKFGEDSSIIDEVFKEADVIIFADYNKGFLNEQCINFFMDIGKKYNKKIIVDSKKKNYWIYNGCFLLTPNKKEAEIASGIRIRNQKNIISAGSLLREIHGSNILMTLGKDGMALFDDDSGLPYWISSASSGVYDVSGAGDTVVAIVSLMTALGYSLRKSCEVANACASHVIKKMGTFPITYEEFIKELSNDETI